MIRIGYLNTTSSECLGVGPGHLTLIEDFTFRKQNPIFVSVEKVVPCAAHIWINVRMTSLKVKKSLVENVHFKVFAYSIT